MCDFNGRSRMPVIKKPAMKVVKKRKHFTCWNQKLIVLIVLLFSEVVY